MACSRQSARLAIVARERNGPRRLRLIAKPLAGLAYFNAPERK